MAAHRSHWLLHALFLFALPAGVLAAKATSATTAETTSTRAVLPGTKAYDPTQPVPSSGTVLTDPYAVFSVPQVPRPAYLAPFIDPTFNSTVERVGSNVGASTAPLLGTWGSDARHVYSKQQPWNSDNTLLTIENRGGGSPTPMILDGTTYLPRYSPCANFDRYDYRWHPSPSHPHEQINVDPAGRELMWFDVTTCTKTRSWALPITVDYGIGSGEGNPSNDGRFVALGNNTAMFVADMDPRPPYAPYPSVRIGPVYTFPPESLTASSPGTWTIDNLSVSPSGQYVDVKFGSADDCGSYDLHRIFEVDPSTLALKPHNMATGSLRCCSFQSRPNGWIFPLKHADMAPDPFDNNEDVLVGGRSCPGSTFGHVVKVRLRDGAVTPLTDGIDESSVYHVSTRNLDRPGWAYVSWFKVDGKRFSDEIMAVKLDASQSVERLCHIHTAAAGCYRCEAHPVPSRDGTRVLFASNWAQDCGAGCGALTDIKDYIVIDAAARVTPVLLSLVSAEEKDGRVQLDWQSSDAAALSASVYRRTESSDWQSLGGVVGDGTGHLRYEDRTVSAGVRYAYRLGYVEQEIMRFTAETWVEVPGLELALEGLRPNPAAGELMASFTLPSGGSARLQLLDVTGRVWLAREVGSLGAGNHIVRLSGAAPVPAGMYWLRLTQGGRSLLARGVVIR